MAIPADAAAEEIFIHGKDAGESLIARITGTVPADGTTANARAVAQQI